MYSPDRLIHFTKGSLGDPGNYEAAFNNLRSILADRCIRGGDGFIKGGYHCVCFSEAPIEEISNEPWHAARWRRYAPFGVLVDKKWIFELGGRPVIYQSSKELMLLPESIRWRHVRYEPNLDPPVDFCWEREWRLRTESLEFTANDITIILPDRYWADRLTSEFDYLQDDLVESYAIAIGNWIADQYREHFPWMVLTLN